MRYKADTSILVVLYV